LSWPRFCSDEIDGDLYLNIRKQRNRSSGLQTLTLNTMYMRVCRDRKLCRSYGGWSFNRVI